MELITVFYIIANLYAIISMLMIAYLIYWSDSRGDITITDHIIMAIQTIYVITMISFSIYCYRNEIPCSTYQNFRNNYGDDFYMNYVNGSQLNRGRTDATTDIRTSSLVGQNYENQFYPNPSTTV